MSLSVARRAEIELQVPSKQKQRYGISLVARQRQAAFGPFQSGRKVPGSTQLHGGKPIGFCRARITSPIQMIGAQVQFVFPQRVSCLAMEGARPLTEQRGVGRFLYERMIEHDHAIARLEQSRLD